MERCTYPFSPKDLIIVEVKLPVEMYQGNYRTVYLQIRPKDYTATWRDLLMWQTDIDSADILCKKRACMYAVLDDQTYVLNRYWKMDEKVERFCNGLSKTHVLEHFVEICMENVVLQNMFGPETAPPQWISKKQREVLPQLESIQKPEMWRQTLDWSRRRKNVEKWLNDVHQAQSNTQGKQGKRNHGDRKGKLNEDAEDVINKRVKLGREDAKRQPKRQEHPHSPASTRARSSEPQWVIQAYQVAVQATQNMTVNIGHTQYLQVKG